MKLHLCDGLAIDPAEVFGRTLEICLFGWLLENPGNLDRAAVEIHVVCFVDIITGAGHI